MEPPINAPSASEPAHEPAREDRRRLALIEVQGPGGRVMQTLDVHAWPLRVGRALDNELVLDDPFVAAQHATLAPGETGTLELRVGDTTNGVRIGHRQVRAGQTVALAANGPGLLVGQTTLRLRLPGEALAPERKLPRGGYLAPWALVACAVLLMLQLLASQWVQLDPGADMAAWLPTLMGLPVLLLGWCGLWAVVSKLFQHRFDFVGHLRIALPWLLAIQLVEVALPWAGATLAWPWLWRLMPHTQALLALLLVRQHLGHVLPLAGRRLGVALAGVAVAGLGLQLTLAHRATDRFSRPPYMSTLPLPSLNLSSPVPSQTLVDDMTPLANRLAARAKRARDEDKSDSADVE